MMRDKFLDRLVTPGFPNDAMVSGYHNLSK